MEGRRCGDVIWGRKQFLMLQRGRSPDQGERREIERERESTLSLVQGTAKTRYLSQTTDRENKRD